MHGYKRQMPGDLDNTRAWVQLRCQISQGRCAAVPQRMGTFEFPSTALLCLVGAVQWKADLTIWRWIFGQNVLFSTIQIKQKLLKILGLTQVFSFYLAVGKERLTWGVNVSVTKALRSFWTMLHFFKAKLNDCHTVLLGLWTFSGVMGKCRGTACCLVCFSLPVSLEQSRNKNCMYL